ncbi:PepSY domain-containing protein [Streptomyces fructofermentans]|uniref:PepSY domain-containing protein n=1 Tax=Streptomyces fructofermentans TaxID=152141 RepID=UPI0033E0677E
MKRNIVIATIAAAALVGGGTATALAVTGDDDAGVKQSSVRVADDDRTDDRDDRDDDGTDRAGTDDRAENAAEAKAAKVTAADAITAALKSVRGTAVSAELDDEGSSLVWDVDVLTQGGNRHSVQVDPGNGKVLGSHADTDTDADDAADDSRARAALKDASVTAAEAAEAAAAKGTVVSVDLDDDRAAGWEAETTGADGTERDWTVDLRTAKVTADASAPDTDTDD